MGNANGKVEPNAGGGGEAANNVSSSCSLSQSSSKKDLKNKYGKPLRGLLALSHDTQVQQDYTVAMMSSMFGGAGAPKSPSKVQVNEPPKQPTTSTTDLGVSKEDQAGGEQPIIISDSLVDVEPQKGCSLADCIRAATPCCQKNNTIVLSDYELHIDGETPPRIMKSLDVIGEYFKQTMERLQSDEGSKDKKFDVKADLLEVIRFCNQGVQLLHRVHEDCGDSLRDLSYYFDQNIAQDQMQLIKGRSAIGSYMWLIVLAMQSIRLGPDQDKDFAEIRRILEDIVGESFVIWRGIRHIVEAFLQVRDKTEELLTDYLEIYNPDVNLKAFLLHRSKLQSDTATEEYSDIIAEQRKHCNQRKKDLAANRKERKRQIQLHNVVGGNENPDYNFTDCKTIPSPPVVYIARSRVDMPDQWQSFQKLRSRDRMIDLTQMVRKVMSLHENVLENLRNMDRCLHLIFVDDQNPSEMSYIQVIGHMKRWLRRVKKSVDQLEPEDLKVLNEISRLLSDEMHMTEFLVMTLRGVIHESRHVIHVAYEYARVFNRSLLLYEEIAPPNELSFCEKIGWKTSKEDFECRKIPLRNAIALFNTSPYIKVLLTFPISFDRRYQLMLKPLGSDVRLQGTPPVGGVFRQVATTKKVVDRVASATSQTKKKQHSWRKK